MKRQNPLQKAYRRIETEGKKHSICLYSATAIALWQYWGKKKEAINRLFELSHVVWNECAKDHDHSMIQMCETETGIEITNGETPIATDDYDFCNHARRKNVSIDQEKMIVEALSSLYPLKDYEEDAIHTILDAIPKWIPVTERLPKDGRQVLVYAMSVHYALAKYDEMRDADGTYKKQWVTFDAWKPYYTIKDVIAWMPNPEPYKEVTK